MCDYMSYWLFKSEPSDYSFEDLINDKETEWEGIRNYQARNFIRDKISSIKTLAHPPAKAARAVTIPIGPQPITNPI